MGLTCSIVASFPHMVALIGVGSGLNPPEVFKSVLRSPLRSTSLNEFWGTRYHQVSWRGSWGMKWGSPLMHDSSYGRVRRQETLKQGFFLTLGLLTPSVRHPSYFCRSLPYSSVVISLSLRPPLYALNLLTRSWPLLSRPSPCPVPFCSLRSKYLAQKLLAKSFLGHLRRNSPSPILTSQPFFTYLAQPLLPPPALHPLNLPHLVHLPPDRLLPPHPHP